MNKKVKKLNSEEIILPVILSGGTGTRLWPLSRYSFPKQYLNLEEKDNYTMFQNTLRRLKKIDNVINPLVICNEEHRFIVAEQLRTINLQAKSILLEPFGRNTAPAILLAALIAKEKSNDPNLLVLSADHKIKNDDIFANNIKEGIYFSQNGRLVVFGVSPTKAETGYGYIESFDELSKDIRSSQVKQFIEKPNLSIAENLIQNKSFSWNSGIFMFKASTIIEEIKRLDINMYDICEKALLKSKKDLDFQRLDRETFQECPNSSIDISVMEKTKLGTVVRLDCGWNDLGSWKSLWDESNKNNAQNVISGKVFAKDTKNSYLRSESRLLVTLGIKNILAIETDDAILIADKEANKSFKNLVADLEKENFNEFKVNTIVHRPWGNYKLINEGKNWKVKKIEITPKATLSLQMHKCRSEHWVIVNGIAKVEIDDNISILKMNESVYIPLGSKHRLSNPGDSILTLIEVQSGEYLEEDDIIRFDDIYGRDKV